MNLVMLFLASILGIFFVIAIRYFSKNKRLLLLHFSLLLISPWFINLLAATPPLKIYLDIKPLDMSLGENVALLTATDYIFFNIFPNVTHITGDLGNLLPSFIPPTITGFWVLLHMQNDKKRPFIFIFLFSIIVSALLFFYIGYLAQTIILFFLSIFATLGIEKFYRIIKEKKSSLTIKSLVLLNFIFIAYEASILLHNIQVELFLNK